MQTKTLLFTVTSTIYSTVSVTTEQPRPQPNRLQDTSMERRLIASLLVADADKPK